MRTLTVRSAGVTDAKVIAQLVTQLGYISTPAQMETRLARLLSDGRHLVIVADVDGSVVGMASACTDYGVQHDAIFGRVTAAVVDAQSRGRGIGARLVRHIEDWCRERGCDRLTLTSASHRTAAHAFYIGLGYEQTGVRFIKQLQETDSEHRSQ
jgi:GNAT superfamily N-acetyltransferase